MKIARTFRLSKKACGIIVRNIVIAIGIKAIFVVLAVIGMATLWMAVFADMGVSLMVIPNCMRALRLDQRAVSDAVLTFCFTSEARLT